MCKYLYSVQQENMPRLRIQINGTALIEAKFSPPRYLVDCLRLTATTKCIAISHTNSNLQYATKSVPIGMLWLSDVRRCVEQTNFCQRAACSLVGESIPTHLYVHYISISNY